jgi:hypothetical protein
MRQAAEHVSHGFSTIGLDETQHVIPLVGVTELLNLSLTIINHH